LVGAIHLGDPQPGNMSALYRGQLLSPEICRVAARQMVAPASCSATLTNCPRLDSLDPDGYSKIHRSFDQRRYKMIDRRNVLKCLTAISIANLVRANAEASTMSEDGLVTIASKFPVKETLNRLEADLKTKDITVFARIDHAAGAASVAMPLRPTELLIFGNPKGGTPLMQSNQTIGIDLPLKILGWQDAGGKVWLTYNDPSWLGRRHHLGAGTDANVSALTTLLTNFAKAAAG
jgi:uncharacterized protein (DUF302 family)